MGKNQEIAELNDLTNLLLHKYKDLIGERAEKTCPIEEIIEQIIKYHENIIACMPGNVYWIDKKGITQGCNKNVLDMFGFTSLSQFKGLNFEKMGKIGHWTEDATQSFKQDTFAVLKTGQAKLNIEEPPIPHTDGREIFFLTSRVPLFDHKGDVIGVVGISIDISERKKMEKELRLAKEAAEAANTAKTMFIANMSHDIRTPLSGILGMSDILEQLLTNEEDKKYARWIHESGVQLLELLNGVLDVSSADNMSEDDLHLETFDLYQQLQNIYKLEYPTAKVKNLDLNIEIDDTVPRHIVCDKIKLHRIILNLLGNAIKFTHEGSITIKVECITREEKKCQLKLSIIDTGIGISKDVQDKIFDRFYRVNPSFKGIYRGHGAGLHIAKKFLTLLGGELKLISQLKSGSTFYFILPIQVAHELKTSSVVDLSVIHNVSDKISLPSLNQINVLIIEDNHIALHLAEKHFQTAGCKVTSVGDAESAFKLMKLHRYDLIVTDVGLPGMSGKEFTALVRDAEKIENTPPIPIIGLTAHAVKDASEECLKSGMNGILTKPIDFSQVQRMLREFIPNDVANITQESHPLFDLKEGIRMMGDEETLREFLQLLVNKIINEDVTALQHAYTEKNWEKLQALAHKTASGAIYCGTVKLKHACHALERQLKTGERNQVEEYYHQLMTVLADTKLYVQDWLVKSKIIEK